MKSKSIIYTLGILIIGLILGYFILKTEKPKSSSHGHDDHGGHKKHGDEHGEKYSEHEDADHEGRHDDNEHGDKHSEEPVKGIHGGRLLKKDQVALELSIFETGVEPQFRAYLYAEGKQVAMDGTKLAVELHRLGGRVDKIAFKPQGEFLLGNQVISEPHSFDVKIKLEYKGKTHKWEYSQEEGRVEMDAASMQASGIKVEIAGPATIQAMLTLNGKIIPNQDKLAHIYPRFAGVVKEVKKQLGDQVKKGDVLATIESNESLELYPVLSQIEGTIVEKHITAGETVGSDEKLFTITDLSSVWVNFNVFRQDFPRLHKGQKVVVDAGEDTSPITSTLAYLSPIGEEHTQTMTVRAVISNAGGSYPPGLFVKGKVVLESRKVPVAVKREAMQTFRDWDVVFIHADNAFEARPVELGLRDSKWIEVKNGLESGEKYVSENSYVIKADLGKAGASHDH